MLLISCSIHFREDKWKKEENIRIRELREREGERERERLQWMIIAVICFTLFSEQIKESYQDKILSLIKT